MHHFQHIASSVNQPKESTLEWSFWALEYAPRSDINATIYTNFMNLPELSEWLEVLHHLPNNKAIRSSQISNEMLKHLGLNTHHKLWILIRAVLFLNDILM